MAPSDSGAIQAEKTRRTDGSDVLNARQLHTVRAHEHVANNDVGLRGAALRTATSTTNEGSSQNVPERAASWRTSGGSTLTTRKPPPFSSPTATHLTPEHEIKGQNRRIPITEKQ